jgi:hypothetical protein
MNKIPVNKKLSFGVCTVKQRVLFFYFWLVLSQVRVELESRDVEGTDNAENIF